MSFKKTFYKSVSTFAVYNYLAQALEFFSTIILSRLLLPEEYGFVAIIHIFASFIRLFSNVGIGHSLVRSDYGYTFHKLLYSLSVWMGFALSAILMLLAYPIGVFFDNMALVIPTLVISIKFIFDSLLYIPFAILSKALNFNLIGKIRLWGTFIQIIITIIMAYLGFSYWSLIIPLIINPIIQYALLKKYVQMPLRIYGWKATKRTLIIIRSLMGNLSLINLVAYWTENTDKVLIGKFYSQADLGIYNRAFRFLRLTYQLIAGIFGTVLFPSLKKLMEVKGDVQKEYMDIIKVVVLFTLPVVFVLVLLPETLVLILWGENWTRVAPFLPYIGLMMMFNSLINTSSSVFILFKKERVLFYVHLANSLITLSLVVAGALISMLHILKFLALGQILLTLPIYLYYGFYKSFGFKPSKILRFFTPAFLFGILLYGAIEYLGWEFRLLVLLGFVVFLLFELKGPVLQSLLFLRKMVLSMGKR
ncbi:MAG: oligosaccharide flippase family protein [Bacteroidales bacterium]